METNPAPHLSIVPPVDYDTRPRLIEASRAANDARARPSYFATLAADWRDVVGEVREHPISHLLVGIATFVGTLLLLFGPLLVLEWVS